MIEEQGKVTACDGSYALVEAERQSTCGGCQVRNGCGTSLLSRFIGRKHSRVRVLNPIGAVPGDSVVIGLDEQALTSASASLYLVPILALIAAAVASQFLAQIIGLSATEPASLIGGLLGLAAGLVFAKGRADRVKGDHRHQAVILRLVEPTKVLVGINRTPAIPPRSTC